MTYPNLTAIARTITRLTEASRNGTFFQEAEKQERILNTTFAAPAVRAAQFAFTMDVDGMDEPIQAYAVITKLESGFDFIMTRDENYLAEHAE